MEGLFKITIEVGDEVRTYLVYDVQYSGPLRAQFLIWDPEYGNGAGKFRYVESAGCRPWGPANTGEPPPAGTGGY
jgi:hypothetical protein